MGALEPTGGDAERMLAVETRLRTEIGDIDALLTSHISTARASAPEAAVSLDHAVSLVGTFCQETGIVADAVLGSRQALGFADGTSVDLGSKIFWLNQSFRDSDGATGAAETFGDYAFERLLDKAFGDGVRPDGTEYVDQLLDQASTDAERRAIWDSLTDTVRLMVLEERPDLGVVFLGAGALDAFELEALKVSTTYTVGSTKLELNVDGEFDVKVFSVTFGGGVSATIQEQSDGTFKLLVGADVYGGLAKELDVKGVEVSAELRAVLEKGQVMHFKDGQGVIDAISALEQAVHDDLNDIAGTARYVGGWLVDANPVFGLSRLFGGPSPGQWIDGDQRPESVKALEQLMIEHGVETKTGIGIEGKASAELGDLGLYGLEGSVSVSVVAYHVDGVEANGGIDSTGVVVAGSLAGSFSTDSPPLVPGTSNADITGGGTIGFSSDTSVDANGNAVNVTTLYVETSVGTVGSLGLGDTIFDTKGNPIGSSITLEQSADATQRHTVTITTPVTTETGGLIGDAALGLAGGDLDGVRALYDYADVTVTSADGVRVTTTGGVDAQVIEVKVEVSTTDKITTSSQNKPAGGEFYDQIEVNQQIDAAVRQAERDSNFIQVDSVTTANGTGSGGGGGSSTSNPEWFTPTPDSGGTGSGGGGGSSTSNPEWFTPTPDSGGAGSGGGGGSSTSNPEWFTPTAD